MAAAGGDLSVSSDFGRERSGQGGASMSASMPLISQLESTFQTGRRLLLSLSLTATAVHAWFVRDDCSSESGSITA